MLPKSRSADRDTNSGFPKSRSAYDDKNCYIVVLFKTYSNSSEEQMYTLLDYNKPAKQVNELKL